MRQVTLFIMADEYDIMPYVEFSSEGKNTTVAISRTVNGQEETETYVFAFDELLDFTTTEKLPVDVETTETESNETSQESSSPESSSPEEESSETSSTATMPSDETVITEAESDSEYESASVEDTDDSEGDVLNSSCRSAVGTAVIPAVITGAALLFFKKRKKK